MRLKKSWRQKLADGKDLPRVEKISGKMSKRWAEGTVVIPSPLEVDEIMKRVPRGKVITINEIRSLLARKHEATIGCPLTTGIFAWIAAHAAEEEANDGRKRITPYWRTLKTGGILNEKYTGGIKAQREKLQSEGHRILKKRGKYIVENLRRALIQGD